MTENKWNKVEEPVITKNISPTSEEKITHPAFGQISASRVTGHVNLYGSDFVHNNYIEITISHSELNRNLSKDWPFASDEIISVMLSEAQWASFVSTLNYHGGTQCTLLHINREPIPQLPSPKPKINQFKKEASETTQRANQELEELAELISGMKIPQKTKKELIKKIEFASRAIGGSVDFVLKQFGEHMEQTVEKAKIEIEAHINERIHSAGLDLLQNSPIKLISSDK